MATVQAKPEVPVQLVAHMGHPQWSEGAIAWEVPAAKLWVDARQSQRKRLM